MADNNNINITSRRIVVTYKVPNDVCVVNVTNSFVFAATPHVAGNNGQNQQHAAIVQNAIGAGGQSGVAGPGHADEEDDEDDIPLALLRPRQAARDNPAIPERAPAPMPAPGRARARARAAPSLVVAPGSAPAPLTGGRARWTEAEMKTLVKEKGKGKSFPKAAESLPGRSAMSCQLKYDHMKRSKRIVLKPSGRWDFHAANNS